jgi:hypothetical protein
MFERMELHKLAFSLVIFSITSEQKHYLATLIKIVLPYKEEMLSLTYRTFFKLPGWYNLH